MQVSTEMAGTVLEIKVKKGEKIERGQEVAVIESMKMEVPISSPASGTVKEILKTVGQFVNAREVILEIA